MGKIPCCHQHCNVGRAAKGLSNKKARDMSKPCVITIRCRLACSAAGSELPPPWALTRVTCGPLAKISGRRGTENVRRQRAILNSDSSMAYFMLRAFRIRPREQGNNYRKGLSRLARSNRRPTPGIYCWKRWCSLAASIQGQHKHPVKT